MKTSVPKALKRANGTGTVYRLSGRRRKPWVAAINKEILGYYAEKSEAQKAMEMYSANGVPDGFNDTLQEVYDRWKDAHFRDLTKKGTEGYEIGWTRLSELHSCKMRNLRTVDFQKIVDEAMTLTKAPKPLSRSGKEKIKQLCSQLCKQAMQDEIINRNYGEFIKLDKEQKKSKEIFTQEDIDKLFAVNSKTAKVILTLIYTGFRINELFNVKLSDVNIEENYIVGGEKTEAGRNRIVPIHKKVKPFVLEWFSESNAFLISNSIGGQMNAHNFRTREYYPLLDALVIERKNPHCTRHTFATIMSAAGVRPEVLQKMIGHADFSTTANIYIHTDIEELQKAINMV